MASTKACKLAADDPRCDTAYTLTLEPSFRLGLTGPRTVEDVLKEISQLAQGGSDPRPRIRAIKYVSHVLVSQRDERLAALLQEMLAQSDRVHLGIEDLANLSLAKAILHYHKRDLVCAKEELRSAVDKLEGSGVSNLASVNVRLGLANLHSSSGEYDIAIKNNLEAYKASSLLGNQRQLALIAANISLCMVRMGNYQAAIEWGRKSYEMFHSFNFGFRPFALYHMGVSLAMLGRFEEATTTVGELVRVAESAGDRSLYQNALLYAADVEATVGRTANAISLARSAIEGCQGLLYKNSAGIYARWSTVIILSDYDVHSARESINGFLKALDEYDSMDKADILCAKHWLDTKAAVTDQETIDRLRILLAKLPAAVTDQLQRANFLRFDSKTARKSVANRI